MKKIYSPFLFLFLWLLWPSINIAALHPCSYHHPLQYHQEKGIVQLVDGSIWQVHPDDIKLMKNWKKSHEIVIQPVHSSFWPDFLITYNYELCNRHDESRIAVYLQEMDRSAQNLLPFIQEIDSANFTLTLNDQSQWQLKNGADLSQWKVGQHLLVGLNSCEKDKEYPQILINTDIPSFPSLAAVYTEME